MPKQSTSLKVKALRKRALNLNVSSDIAELFTNYCSKNYRAGSVSQEVERHMISVIATKGSRYGLNLPARFSR